MTTAEERIMLAEPVELLVLPVADDEDDDEGADAVTAAMAAAAVLSEELLADLADEFGFNPNQRRGPDGKWIKGAGGGLPSVPRAVFDGKARPGAATRLTSAEFEKRVPPEARYYRGVHAPVAAEHTRDGGIGNGDFGPGVYMDPRIATAQGYAGRNGVVMRMGLQPGTKVKRIPQRVARGGSRAIDEWATEGKFDAISTGDGLYVIVRNPDVLITDERDYTTRETTILEYLAKGYDMPDGYEAEIEALQRDGIIPAPAGAAFKFDPNQPRDHEGKWTDGPVGGGGGGGGTVSGLSAWREQEASADLPLETAEVFRLGTAIAKIMSRDGTTVNDPVAFFEAATEALADSDVTARQYIATLDRSYGTGMAERVEAGLMERDGGTDAPAAASGPKLPDFSAPYADRVAAMEATSRTTPRATSNLAGGQYAEVVRSDWDDRSRTITKRALRAAGNSGEIDPVTQADAEELAAKVADVLAVRAPAVRRISADEVEMEFMPGRSGMDEFGAIAPKSITEAPENARIGLLDYLTNNADRHTGNWMVDDDGAVYPIDHGLAFQSNIGILAYGPFSLAHGFSIGTPKNVTVADLQQIRSGLEGLRSDFAAAGRAEWFDGMMSRLDDVETRLEAAK